MGKSNIKKHIEIKNRKASYLYELLDTYEAGIQLKGTEIKAIREGRANLSDSYCYFELNGDLVVKNMHIGPYSKASYEGHEYKRERKLLLRKQQLNRLHKKVTQRGRSIIPTRLYIGASGYAKLEIALAKGKKKHDKRASLKKKAMDREIERELKKWQ